MTRVRQLMGKTRIKKGQLPRKFAPGTGIKFGKKSHSVSYPIKGKK